MEAIAGIRVLRPGQVIAGQPPGDPGVQPEPPDPAPEHIERPRRGHVI